MKVSQSVAKWEFCFFNQSQTRPTKVLYEPEAAMAYMKKAVTNTKMRRQGVYMELVHVPSGLRREVGNLQEAEFLVDGIVDRLGVKLYDKRH